METNTIFNNQFSIQILSKRILPQSFRDYSTDTDMPQKKQTKPKQQSLRKQNPHLHPVCSPQSQTINLSRVSELCKNFGISDYTFFIHGGKICFSFFVLFFSIQAKSVQLCEHFVISAEHRQRRFNRSVCLLMQSEAAS